MKSDGTIIFSKTTIIADDKWNMQAKQTEIDITEADAHQAYRYSQRLRNKLGEVTDIGGGETTSDTRIENLVIQPHSETQKDVPKILLEEDKE